jgi:hypothetical protein
MNILFDFESMFSGSVACLHTNTYAYINSLYSVAHDACTCRPSGYMYVCMYERMRALLASDTEVYAELLKKSHQKAKKSLPRKC